MRNAGPEYEVRKHLLGSGVEVCQPLWAIGITHKKSKPQPMLYVGMELRFFPRRAQATNQEDNVKTWSGIDLTMKP